MPSSHFSDPAARPFVLIADDEPAVLEVLHSMVHALGWQPLLADTGTQALELFRAHHADIDCAIVDLHMPQVNGLQLLHEIRTLAPATRVLIMTGDHLEADSFVGAGDSPDGVLSKPFFMTDLEQALASARREAA